MVLDVIQNKFLVFEIQISKNTINLMLHTVDSVIHAIVCFNVVYSSSYTNSGALTFNMIFSFYFGIVRARRHHF